MRYSLLPLVTLLAACPSGDPLSPNVGDTDPDGQDTGDTDDTDEPELCSAMLQSISPDDGTIDVQTDTVVEVQFNEAVLEGEWSVSITGVDGVASLDASGTVATFTPTTALEHETEYTIEAQVCQNSATTRFTTVAAPLDVNLLDGRTYELPYADLVWKAPNSASLLASFIDFDSFLVQVDEIDEVAQTLGVVATVGYNAGGVSTPECNGMFSPGVGDFSQNPTFSAGPDDMVLPMGTEELTIEDFSLQASFNSDGTAITSITFSGRADTRPLDTLLGSSTCSMASLFGDKCVACADGAVKCLDLLAQAKQADWNPNVDLVADCP